MKRKALGKGLSALLPDPEPAPAADGGPGGADGEPGAQPATSRGGRGRRRAAGAGAPPSGRAGSCSRSWSAAVGERYQIIAGERRWRAAQRAGLGTVPVTVREVPDDRLLELALVENIQRQELTPLEEAAGLPAAAGGAPPHPGGGGPEGGPDRSTVANTLRLLRLPPRGPRARRRTGASTPGTAGRCWPWSGPEDQVALAREAARRGLSVREVERRVALLRAPPARGAPRRDPNTRAAEERLRRPWGRGWRSPPRRKGARSASRSPARPSCNRLFEPSCARDPARAERGPSARDVLTFPSPGRRS